MEYSTLENNGVRVCRYLLCRVQVGFQVMQFVMCARLRHGNKSLAYITDHPTYRGIRVVRDMGFMGIRHNVAHFGDSYMYNRFSQHITLRV